MTTDHAPAELDAAALRLAFREAVNTYPAHLAAFLTKEGEAAFRAWWGRFYGAVTRSDAGLAVLAELDRLRAAAGVSPPAS